MSGRICFIGGRSAKPLVLTLVLVLLSAGIGGWLSAAGEPVAELKAAVAMLSSGRTQAGVAALRSLAPRMPQIADYLAFLRASANFNAGDFTETIQALDPVFRQTPVSPLQGRAAILGAQAYQKDGNPRAALELLRRYSRSLAQPEGELEIARSLEAANDLPAAVASYQNIYARNPASKESSEAQEALTRLQAQLADRYPAISPALQLARALKLLDGGDANRARRELTALAPQLTGTEREIALVKIGTAGYMARDASIARYLESLSVTTPDADAERLYYLFLSARRASNRSAMQDQLGELSRRYPTSKLRLDALQQMAAPYLVDNQSDDYEPLYRACYQSFSKETKAASCHWKVAWAHYLHRKSDAADLLREQLRMFPDSDDAPAALYYLARLAQEAGENATAGTYYRFIAREYPNRYYAIPSRTRFAETPQPADPNATAFLQSIPFTARNRVREFQPNANSRVRLERARLLAAADLDDWWPVELRYAADREDQPHVMAMELARQENRRGNFDQALRYVKHYVPDYLSIPFESAPPEFWRLAFPLPYRAEMERQARENGLDPLFVAALVRQESEFNPKAVSTSNARGLAQIMPATGLDLSRRLKLKPYTTARLFQPQISLRLGTYYLKTIADRFNGRWEAVLAAYNAGPSRVSTWSTWAEFREPSEFIETVPFAQTRDYVQIILRNADIYHRVYPTPVLPIARVNHDTGDVPGVTTRSTGAR